MKKTGTKDNKTSIGWNKGGPALKRIQKKRRKIQRFFTVILECKKAPYRFMGEEGAGPNQDESFIQIIQERMDKLKIFKSKTFFLKGKKEKK